MIEIKDLPISIVPPGSDVLAVIVTVKIPRGIAYDAKKKENEVVYSGSEVIYLRENNFAFWRVR